MRVKFLCGLHLVVVLLAMSSCCFAQPGTWTWMHGSNTPNSPGNFGVQGVFAPTNDPPALYEACSWVDQQGNFWLFGGLYQNVITQTYNTMWKYDVSINQWAWISGSNTVNGPPVYGTMGVPSVNNTPSCHGYGAMNWTDNNGNFWLFGGLATDALGNTATIGALWRFNPTTLEWTWIRGSNVGSFPGNYGTQGVPSPTNDPPGRMESTVAWTDSQGDLWMFGGATLGMANDLWKYNVATNMWTWMDGQATTNAPRVMGPRGVESPGFDPGGRMVYAHGIDAADNLYLYGGSGASSSDMSDMWRYNTITGNWAWLGGLDAGVDTGRYVCTCGTDERNNPGIAHELKTCWTDECGIWFFGGGGASSVANALWHFEFNSASFALVQNDQPFNYGTQGVSAFTNIPPVRLGGVPWTDNNGNLWMFGGSGSGGSMNDLWKYEIDPACACTDSMCLQEIDAPNVFTPDNDGVNDEFVVIGMHDGDQLEIYDRWGARVYVSSDNDYPWDGNYTNGDPCTSGVYYYVIYNSATAILAKGFLHLVR